LLVAAEMQLEPATNTHSGYDSLVEELASRGVRMTAQRRALVQTIRDQLACFRCGGIAEFSSSPLDRLKGEIGMQTRFVIRVTRLEIGGQCGICAAYAESPEKEDAIRETAPI
jgi:Fe2+ or Zn2+ uptake regulation protein